MTPVKIGNLELKQNRPVFLAPMAGVTDLPFRLLCKEQGCDVMCTEMICSVTFPGTEVREETGERRVEECSDAAVLVTAADASQRGAGRCQEAVRVEAALRHFGLGLR